MKPIRLSYTYELLKAYGAFEHPSSILVQPRLATKTEILLYHTEEYLTAVENLGKGKMNTPAYKFNLGHGDNPVYLGMHEAALLSTGASLRGVELLHADRIDAAFSISGGLHHAMPNYASGFCIYNDPVIAIKKLLSVGHKVAYIDIDCHHGDGVQNAFYETDSVLTISIHESGEFLFPGTGFVHETGTGTGRGFSVNLPLYPYTSDKDYLWAFKEIVLPLIHRFEPDVLVTQLGIDSHYKDPITHLSLTTQGHADIVAQIAGLSPGKWLALGGGGYDISAVARAWTLDYGIISEQGFINEIPSSFQDRLDIASLIDEEEVKITPALRKTAGEFAERSVREVIRLIFPIHKI